MAAAGRARPSAMVALLLGALRASSVPWKGGAPGELVAASSLDRRFNALLGPHAGKRCYAAFLFHVEKCAGTTFRKHFEKLEDVQTFRQGSVIFLRRHPEEPLVPHERCSDERSWFREDRSCTWEQLVDDLEAHPPARAARAGDRRRIFVEMATMTASSVHHEDNLARIVDGVQRVRAAWEPAGCEVVLFGLVREPVSHLLATYNYFVVNAQKRQPKLFGSSFDEWIASPFVHNLQSRLILGEMVIRLQVGKESVSQVQTVESGQGDGAKASELARSLAPRVARMYRTTPEQVFAAHPRMLEQLGRFDFLAPVDKFDELWFLVADRVGLSQLRYKSVNTGNFTRMQREAFRKLGRARRVPQSRPDGLAVRPPLVHALDKQTAERLRRQKLSADVALFANVTRAWRDRVAALDAATRARMERFGKIMRRVRADEVAHQQLIVELYEARQAGKKPGSPEFEAAFRQRLSQDGAFHAGPAVRRVPWEGMWSQRYRRVAGRVPAVDSHRRASVTRGIWDAAPVRSHPVGVAR